MHESLLRDLYNILQRVFDPKPLNPKPILIILNQHIYSNPLFTETDLTNYISELKLGITVCLPRVCELISRILQKKSTASEGRRF